MGFFLEEYHIREHYFRTVDPQGSIGCLQNHGKNLLLASVFLMVQVLYNIIRSWRFSGAEDGEFLKVKPSY